MVWCAFAILFCQGLALEGAQWDAEASTLGVSTDDQSVSTLIPKSSFRWVPESKLVANRNELLVPLYANNERAEVLVTLNLPIPEDKPVDFWHPRAVALIGWSS